MSSSPSANGGGNNISTFQRDDPLRDLAITNDNTSESDRYLISLNITNFLTIAPSSDGSYTSVPEMDGASSIIMTVGLPILMLLLVCWCSRGNAPGQEYWRGAQIRETARRITAQRLLKKQREDLSPEARQTQIYRHMRTMTIISKDSRSGYLKLSHIGDATTGETASITPIPVVEETGYVNHRIDSSVKDTTKSDVKLNERCRSESKSIKEGYFLETAIPEQEQENDDDVMAIRRTGSSDTALTHPVVVDEDEDDSDERQVAESGSQPKTFPVDMEQNEEDVCYICLDPFEVGDVVMWSRHPPPTSRIGELPSISCDHQKGEKQTLGCRHVFHQECIMPWLMEKRENECPSCRAPLLIDESNLMEDEENQYAGAPPQQEWENGPGNFIPGISVPITPVDPPMLEIIDVVIPDGTSNNQFIHPRVDGVRTLTIDNEFTDLEEQDVNNNHGIMAFHSETNKENENEKNEEEEGMGITMDNDIEEGYSFVIAKGLIQTVPNHYGSLASLVPFRHNNMMPAS